MAEPTKHPVEIVLREGRCYARIVTETDLGDQSAAIAASMKQPWKLYPSGYCKYGRVGFITNDPDHKKGVVILALGQNLNLASMTFMRKPGSKEWVWPGWWHNQSGTTAHNPTDPQQPDMMTALPTFIKASHKLFIAVPVMWGNMTWRHDYNSGGEPFLFCSDDAQLYQAPLPHVSPAATLCLGDTIDEAPNREQFIEKIVTSMLRSKWVAHYVKDNGNQFGLKASLRDDGSMVATVTEKGAKASFVWQVPEIHNL